MATETILLTGSSGHIGYRVLLEALGKGYTVRATARNQASADKVTSSPSVQPFLSQLSFVIVPDITAESAFDAAVQGVDHIVHVASPLGQPSVDYETSLIRPAVRGTLSVLYSALKAPTIKKVVITSSVAAVRPDDTSKPFTADNIVPDPQGPYAHPFEAYIASKVKAIIATRRFVAEHSPKFNVINVMPTFVIGKNELATTTKDIYTGSNTKVLAALIGIEAEPAIMASTVHVEDVAFIHIAALRDSVKGNYNFGANSHWAEGGIQFQNAIEIVKKRFPEAVKEGIFPFVDAPTSIKVTFDASKTEEVLGFKFKNFEEQVVSLAAWYIEAARRERK